MGQSAVRRCGDRAVASLFIILLRDRILIQLIRARIREERYVYIERANKRRRSIEKILAAMRRAKTKHYVARVDVYFSKLSRESN